MADIDDSRVLDPQGRLIASEILVPQDAVTDDVALVESVVDFVNWTMDTPLLVFGEIPPEAYWCYHADYYLAQVNNGGHGQFARNSGMGERTLDNCRRGLVAMGATDYLAIFDAFMTIMTGDPALTTAIKDGGGFGKIDPAIEQIDSRFYKLGNMTTLSAAWLRRLPMLTPLSADELSAAREAIVARNPLHHARTEHMRFVKERHAATDPLQVAARAICAQEGIAFEGANAGLPAGDGAINWGIQTSAGFRWLLIEKPAATMRSEGGGLRGFYFFETKAPYPAGVGNGAQRQALLSASVKEVHMRIDAARKATARQEHKLPALVVAEFLFDMTSVLVANLCTHAQRMNVAISCPYSREIAAHASYIPRAASPKFARSEEYDVFRMIIGNALWDSVLAMDVLTDAAFADRDRAAALLANLGAAASLAAASVRLLDGQRIHALSLLATADLARERINIRLQLQEITRWWLRYVPAAIAVFTKTEFSQRIPFFTSPCADHARRLAQQLRTEATTGITDALAYFDSEYPALSPAELPAIYDKALQLIVKRFAASRGKTKAWVAVIAELRRVVATVYPFDQFEMFVVPKPKRLLSTQGFFGVAQVTRGTSKQAQNFEFGKDGARMPQ